MPIQTRFSLLKRRRTKIIATLGPACTTPERIEALLEAGVDVFRMNLSHGTHEEHRASYALVRDGAERTNRSIAILADLCGPKIRTGSFRGGSIRLTRDQQVTVTTREVTGEDGLIPSQYASLARDVSPGDPILLADGAMELAVDSTDGTDAVCTVIHGGELGDRKGINLPMSHVSAPSLTEKDRVDAHFALELGVDYLALSFVRRATDVEALKRLISDAGRDTPIIAKIEKREALDAIDEIVKIADGLMVARGDLGVEVGPQYVPLAQDELIDLGRRHRRPVIVATQMLESMIHQARPTRAEVSDVAYAVSRGADAVMLSAETSVGEFPIEAVTMMDQVARQTEAHQWRDGAFRDLGEEMALPAGGLPLPGAIARATALLSRDLRVRAIIVRSRTGTSARVTSAARPAAPVLAFTSNPIASQRMALLWGVVPMLVAEDEMLAGRRIARQLALRLELGDPGQHILLVQGFSADPERNAPSISVLQL